ncbi:hypothetical protein N5D52_14890 [Pseudomonas sp. GD03860]|nr:MULTISPECIES: hypothetical protein [Pseudomonas]MDD2056573.1 hypothetical protein [Pseudomonas putida]MDH0638232.1 hypothetical protein [Pseudomonas sp. GD03860]
MNTTPRLAAQFDWKMVGAFSPEQFNGEQRKVYEDEAARIQRQWDNQPN